MVFVPTMSSYAITAILGNAKVSVIGSSINLVLTTLSQNMGSFMALIMLIIMMVLSFSLYWIELSDIMLSHLIQNVYILNIAILRIFHLDY